MTGLSEAIQRLSQISKKMGVTLKTLPTFKPIVMTGTISEMIKSGKLQQVKPDEVLRSANGEVLFLYIPDHHYLMERIKRGTAEDTPEKRNKVHLFYCATLQGMGIKGRRYRYVATNEHSGKFPIKYSDTDERQSELNVCKYCMNLLEQDKFGNYYNFDFKGFSKHYDYAVPWFEGIPKTLYNIDYPPDWKQISYQIRSERGWKCEKCGKDCSHQKNALDLHHINGIKSDCSRKNLVALCRSCHKKEPFHEHMKDFYEP